MTILCLECSFFEMHTAYYTVLSIEQIVHECNLYGHRGRLQ